MFAIRRPVKAAILLAILAALSGCGTIPAPAASLEKSQIVSGKGPPSHIGIVLKCISSNIEENAGLTLAGTIVEEGESPYLFALSGKSDGLLVVRVKEFDVADRVPHVRLALVVRVFDGSGQNVYARTISGVSTAGLTQGAARDLEKEIQTITEGILRQYAKDPILRPLILKYKLGSLLKFF
jgi:hypothetical protein